MPPGLKYEKRKKQIVAEVGGVKECFKLVEWHQDLEGASAAAAVWKDRAESQFAVLRAMPLKELREQGALMGIDLRAHKTKTKLMAAICHP